MQTLSVWKSLEFVCGVRDREVERRPCNHEVPSSSPGSGSQLWDFSLAHSFRREYWCSSQEGESREIRISCKSLKFVSGVRGHQVERRPCNHEVPSSSPGSGSQLWDFSLAHSLRREYWCSSQEGESREIRISCKSLKFVSGVRGCQVERRPRNHEVPSSSPGSGSQLWNFSLAHSFQCEYWCSSQEGESREIRISCKNLFLNRCKINMFKLKLSICHVKDNTYDG